MFAKFVQTFKMNSKAKELQKDLEQAKKDLTQAELTVVGLKMRVERLRKEIALASPIKWVYVIKRCMIGENDTSRPATVSDIISYIEHKMKIEAGRDVKNKVVSTLSRMYNNEEICKGEYDGIIYYGYPELFEDDKKTLKARVRALLDV